MPSLLCFVVCVLFGVSRRVCACVEGVSLEKLSHHHWGVKDWVYPNRGDRKGESRKERPLITEAALDSFPTMLLLTDEVTLFPLWSSLLLCKWKVLDPVTSKVLCFVSGSGLASLTLMGLKIQGVGDGYCSKQRDNIPTWLWGSCCGQVRVTHHRKTGNIKGTWKVTLRICMGVWDHTTTDKIKFAYKNSARFPNNIASKEVKDDKPCWLGLEHLQCWVELY